MIHREEFIKELLLQNPDMPSRALARLAYSKAPELFTNVEYARNCIRYFRGSNGNNKRPYKLFTMPPPLLPPSRKRLKDDWKALDVNDKNYKALILNDVHIPYHELKPLKMAFDFGQKESCNLILLNGDILDCHACSFWETDPRERDFKEEVNSMRLFLDCLRDRFPKARIIYKLGNHEERWERYMWRKAPELLGVKEFELGSLLHLEKHNIELVEDKRPIRLGNLNIVHGHEYKQPFTNPVNPARGLFLRTKSHAMCGHYHQASYHTDKTVEENVIATWSVGCLCDIHAWYMPLNNWTHGFATVETDSKGRFNVQNKVVRNGKLY